MSLSFSQICFFACCRFNLCVPEPISQLHKAPKYLANCFHEGEHPNSYLL